MRRAILPVLAISFLAASRAARPLFVTGSAERIAINDNRSAAGIVRGNVLTIHLEAREGLWHPDGDAEPGIVVRAFAEKGKGLQVPGPLIRVPEGTEIHASITNTFVRGTLVVHGLSRRGTTTSATDTTQVAAGATREVRFVAGAPGTYYYWAALEGDATQPDDQTRDAELNGAFVIDPAGTHPNDRVFLISLWSKPPNQNGIITRNDFLRFTINGKAWPNTEHLTYDIHDTVRFRLINTTIVPHPMHLHGFYFSVNSRGNGSVDSVYDRASPAFRVVTERVAPGRTMSMTWVPERTGNWMFHCHDNFHVLRNRPLDGTPLPAEHMVHTKNHARDMMGGLVMAIEVRGRESTSVAMQSGVRRRLRLIARVDSAAGGTLDEPAYRYVLEEGTTSSALSASLPGPAILLKRGQPASITVVNELSEPTSVHWHGIELESYFDGVADLSGSARHIAPAIAPGDSFEARFTPPRSGTFMYHPHADETRQQQAGLSGAILIVDDPAAYDPSHDIVLLLSVPRRDADRATILVNGSNTPRPLELRVGDSYRFRIVDIHTYRPSMIVRLFSDSTMKELASWRPVAKDGMPIPAQRSVVRPALQQMGNGETYDYELTPQAPGELRFTVWSAAGDLLVTLPVRLK